LYYLSLQEDDLGNSVDLVTFLTRFWHGSDDAHKPLPTLTELIEAQISLTQSLENQDDWVIENHDQLIAAALCSPRHLPQCITVIFNGRDDQYLPKELFGQIFERADNYQNVRVKFTDSYYEKNEDRLNDAGRSYFIDTPIE